MRDWNPGWGVDSMYIQYCMACTCSQHGFHGHVHFSRGIAWGIWEVEIPLRKVVKNALNGSPHSCWYPMDFFYVFGVFPTLHWSLLSCNLMFFFGKIRIGWRGRWEKTTKREKHRSNQKLLAIHSLKLTCNIALEDVKSQKDISSSNHGFPSATLVSGRVRLASFRHLFHHLFSGWWGAGDYLRAITTPQRKLSGEDGEEGATFKTAKPNPCELLMEVGNGYIWKVTETHSSLSWLWEEEKLFTRIFAYICNAQDAFHPQAPCCLIGGMPYESGVDIGWFMIFPTNFLAFESEEQFPTHTGLIRIHLPCLCCWG